MPIVPPAIAYLATVFTIAFGLGVLRTLWLIPLIGEVAAVLAEVAVLLTVSWIVAGAVLRRWPLPDISSRTAMGALAFAGLMTLEFTLGRFGFGRPVAAMLAQMTTHAGLIGLAGQIGFGLVPVFRR